jgi:hypothetical protein
VAGTLSALVHTTSPVRDPCRSPTGVLRIVTSLPSLLYHTEQISSRVGFGSSALISQDLFHSPSPLPHTLDSESPFSIFHCDNSPLTKNCLTAHAGWRGEEGMKRKHKLVAHTCNLSYLGGWDQADGSLRPTWTNSSQDPISKLTRAKWTGGIANVVQCLLCKHEVLSSKPSPPKKKMPEWKPKSSVLKKIIPFHHTQVTNHLGLPWLSGLWNMAL